jgi:hypothetical protein
VTGIKVAAQDKEEDSWCTVSPRTMEPEPDAAATESMAAHLISMRIAEGPAHSYAAVLVEQGYDTAALFDEIDPDELKRCACTLPV